MKNLIELMNAQIAAQNAFDAAVQETLAPYAARVQDAKTVEQLKEIRDEVKGITTLEIRENSFEYNSFYSIWARKLRSLKAVESPNF